MTLIEMVISLGMLVMILGASISLILIAARAMSNEGSNVGADAAAARSASDQIVDDLKVATAIAEQTATAITMTVPDRDGDALAETIRYSWNGAAGQPLMRQYNTRPAAAIASNVTHLNFTYLTKTAGKPPPVEGSLDIQYEHSANSSLSPADLSLGKCVAGTFKPKLDAKAVRWKITKVQAQMAIVSGTAGSVTATLFYAGTDYKPTGAPLQFGTVALANLQGTAAWTNIDFASTADLDPTRSVCIILSPPVTSGSSASVMYDANSSEHAAAMLISTTAGLSWNTATTGNAVQFRVWGTVSTQEAETLDFQPLPKP